MLQPIFRPWKFEDAPAFVEAVHASLDTLHPWMTWAHENYSETDARNWIRFTQIQREKQQAEELGIFAEDGTLLGGAGIRYPVDRTSLSAIGYWVRSSAQRQGIATCAIHHLASIGFAHPHIHTIEILAAADNLASRAAAARAGAIFMEARYGLIILDSGPVDTTIYQLRRPNFS